MFYPECKPITDFNMFEKFMFLNNNNEQKEVEKEEVEKDTQKKEEVEKEVEEEKETNIINRLEKECIFTKNVQDGLFWSMYILQYGYTEYDRNKYNYGKIEVQEKEKIAEYLHNRGSSKISKETNYKLTRGFCCEIESDLITKPKMSFSGLIGMCAYYKCNIIVVDLTKKIYYSFSTMNTTEEEEEEKVETYILYKNPLYTGKYKSNEYFIDIDHKIYSLSEINEHFFRIENFQKPMKSITNYKKIELECILTKMLQKEFDNDSKEKMDKIQLYEKILLHVCVCDFEL